MIPRNIIKFNASLKLFKRQACTTLPTPYISYFRDIQRHGTSNMAAHRQANESDNHQPEYASPFNIHAYQNRLADVKYNFEKFNIVEAQDSIAKIVNDLETLRVAYLNRISQISVILLDAYYYKGVCFSKGGLTDMEVAIKAFKNALDINPQHENSKIGLMKAELAFGIDSAGHPIINKHYK
jgi:hypothetical protein